jgi:hypothetical protein
LSTALFVVLGRPAIVDDVTLVSPAGGQRLRRSSVPTQSSSSSSSSRAAAQACRWWAQRRGGGPAGLPALAAVFFVLAARREDCRIGGEGRWRPDKFGSSQPLLPPLSLPQSSRQPQLLPPTLPLQPSVDGWLLCRLLRHLPPDLSSAAFVVVIVRSSTLSPAAAVPYHRPSSATVLLRLSCPSITFITPIDGWLLRSLPAHQHTD